MYLYTIHLYGFFLKELLEGAGEMKLKNKKQKTTIVPG